MLMSIGNFENDEPDSNDGTIIWRSDKHENYISINILTEIWFGLKREMERSK